ncbi:hypothetical protein LWI28_013897 [Acer negundo]|uniref:Uncharacterized protein n=1 Tax=Acer negundo TaxID=4023 RepID=A0AAD5J5H6_ACENE|nr:hypothetical protein LWI28_013897 [Acer negundo]
MFFVGVRVVLWCRESSRGVRRRRSRRRRRTKTLVVVHQSGTTDGGAGEVRRRSFRSSCRSGSRLFFAIMETNVVLELEKKKVNQRVTKRKSGVSHKPDLVFVTMALNSGNSPISQFKSEVGDQVQDF